MKNRGIAFKLIVLILTSITAIFFLAFSVNYYYSRKMIIERLSVDAGNLTKSTVNLLESKLIGVQEVPENIAAFLSQPDLDEEMLRTVLHILLYTSVADNPEIYGATIAFEPYALDESRYAPYYFKENGKVISTEITYDYFKEDWYQIPKALGQPVWSEPYFDEGAGNIVMTTYSVPFYRDIGGVSDLMGIVTADISLEWLQKIVASIKIAETGYGFLITKNGTYVTHPKPETAMNETIFTVAEARGDKDMRKVGRSMIWGESGFVPFISILTEKACWMAYEPLSSSGWSLGALFPRDELMSDIDKLNRLVILLFICGIGFIGLVIVLISRTITRPLRMLSGATTAIATGDLNVGLPEVKSRDEVGRLKDAFDFMQASLKQHIRELTEATAARERIESELTIARDIQMGILPKVFPPFPDRPEIDLHAVLEPAREVGGDLYDFFFLDDNHLCFTVGDVSGKGIPASLFMAVTRTMIKTKASRELTPAQVLDSVNRDLAADNPSMMFVTLFLGILDVYTGELTYSNGGHDSPYLLLPDGSLEVLDPVQGILLGVEASFSYSYKTVMLEKGTSLFLYTDGVTEAMNINNELFSAERFEKTISLLKGKHVEEMTEAVLSSIKAFSAGAEQFDDITLLVLRYNG